MARRLACSLPPAHSCPFAPSTGSHAERLTGSPGAAARRPTARLFGSSAGGGGYKIAFLSISATKSFENFPKPSVSSHSLARMQHLPLIIATFTFLLAGLVKVVIGLGLPTVAMCLLSVVMLTAKAASILIVPSFVTNVWQLPAGPNLS